MAFFKQSRSGKFIWEIWHYKLKGEEVFPTIYDEIRLQTNNLIAINLNHEFGYKDIKGKDIIPLGKYYDNQWIAHDGFSKISYHNKYGFIGKMGLSLLQFMTMPHLLKMDLLKCYTTTNGFA